MKSIFRALQLQVNHLRIDIRYKDRMIKGRITPRFLLKTPAGLLVAMFFIVSEPVQAAPTTINITGIITIPPCVVNNNSTISVDFGSVDATSVDGTQNAKSTTVPVSCAYYANSVAKVLVSGTAMVGAGSNVLQTASGPNMASLGVALYQGIGLTNPLQLNTYVSINDSGWTGNVPNSNFTFTSVPYKKAGGGTLVAGAFSATAQISITYN